MNKFVELNSNEVSNVSGGIGCNMTWNDFLYADSRECPTLHYTMIGTILVLNEAFFVLLVCEGAANGG